MDIYPTPAEVLRKLHVDRPVLGFRPHAAASAARWFLDNFPGETLYAVKANDSPKAVAALFNAGIRHFDVASATEVRAIADLPGAVMHIMHPVKSRKFIAEAYFDYGVRTFSLDSDSELDKILAVTGNAKDLTLVVRVACPSTYSEISLEGKFGAPWSEAPGLIRRARQNSNMLGVSFHAGSQMMCPVGYGQVLRTVSQQIVRAATLVDIVDVGGGFPSRYPGMEPPALDAYMDEIRGAFDKMAVGYTCQLWCEPGRALVAEAESVIVRVDARRGDTLYVNDGAFGTLYDAAHCKWVFPTRAYASDGEPMRGREKAFDFYGPTCDSADYLAGPFMLPESIDEGDFIEIGNIGAYGRVMASHFNGCGYYDEVVLEDEPMLSMYGEEAAATSMKAAL
ncbi:Orn/DAP/Arg decarboxylase 2 [Rhodomicrobium vannielii ATCC 17100]|uniref:Orn/DAP/Arg decarboxylase 2 n=1 Tax=Rhodomicrobium vannielii (strain ATCC 17100 / DSM 162 / LMG 4299 / NCIMB 10020 / ATH 3.1.1) TaxID=648757 RepID=E3I3W0_RHOVT|nr:Orn/DAP/Arg decarboxylase 2 [Rhodomicrobium vannielii ATCC 17100]